MCSFLYKKSTKKDNQSCSLGSSAPRNIKPPCMSETEKPAGAFLSGQYTDPSPATFSSRQLRSNPIPQVICTRCERYGRRYKALLLPLPMIYAFINLLLPPENFWVYSSGNFGCLLP